MFHRSDPLRFRFILHIALVSSQSSEPSRAFGDTRLHLDGRVKIVRFLPQTLRLFSLAGIVFEDREAANGVGKIERRSVFVAAIERQGFMVAGLGQPRTSGLVVNVAEMPDRVRERKRLVHLAEDSDGFLVAQSILDSKAWTPGS